MFQIVINVQIKIHAINVHINSFLMAINVFQNVQLDYISIKIKIVVKYVNNRNVNNVTIMDA